VVLQRGHLLTGRGNQGYDHAGAEVDVEVTEAQELAGDRIVVVNAGDVGSQILAAGLVDDVAMDVVPVAFGTDGLAADASAGHPSGHCIASVTNQRPCGGVGPRTSQ
jgi:dihydrofolate reductase